MLLKVFLCASVLVALILTALQIIFLFSCLWCWGWELTPKQALILQVAKKASVLKRRKSKSRMEVPPEGAGLTRRESEGDVVFYVEEPKAGKSRDQYLYMVVS